MNEGNDTEQAFGEALTDDELTQVAGGTDGVGGNQPPPRPQL